jgi:Kef-type K+ transport system membrane component KefB
MTAIQEFFQSELGYVVVLFLLFVFSRMLQRWRVPSAVTSFALGAIGAMGFGLFEGDKTLHLLSTFGIVALFLFAGLDVDLHMLRERAVVLSQHLAVRVAMLAIATVVAVRVYTFDVRPALLIALALLTPSTGFILDSLQTFGLTSDEGVWVKNKAIATELLALGVLFVALQSTSIERLGIASFALVAIIAMLPPVFRFFAVFVAPWAPKSEFAFLLMMAIVVSYATRQLGVYYLVGAFLVGVAARRFRESLPAMASERMLHAVEVFASFFAPFYFFVAGSEMRRGDFTVLSVLIGVALTATVIPFRLGAVMVHRRVALGEPTARSIRVALPMMPTLVFTLVIAGILRDRFGLAPEIFGALIVYTILDTVLPGVILRTPAATYDAPELPPATVFL